MLGWQRITDEKVTRHAVGWPMEMITLNALRVLKAAGRW